MVGNCSVYLKITLSCILLTDGFWLTWKFYGLNLKGQLFSQEEKKRINFDEKGQLWDKCFGEARSSGQVTINNWLSTLVILGN